MHEWKLSSVVIVMFHDVSEGPSPSSQESFIFNVFNVFNSFELIYYGGVGLPNIITLILASCTVSIYFIFLSPSSTAAIISLTGTVFGAGAKFKPLESTLSFDFGNCFEGRL